jgi:hypothetical protein
LFPALAIAVLPTPGQCFGMILCRSASSFFCDCGSESRFKFYSACGSKSSYENECGYMKSWSRSPFCQFLFMEKAKKCFHPNPTVVTLPICKFLKNNMRSCP